MNHIVHHLVYFVASIAIWWLSLAFLIEAGWADNTWGSFLKVAVLAVIVIAIPFFIKENLLLSLTLVAILSLLANSKLTNLGIG